MIRYRGVVALDPPKLGGKCRGGFPLGSAGVSRESARILGFEMVFSRSPCGGAGGYLRPRAGHATPLTAKKTGLEGLLLRAPLAFLKKFWAVLHECEAISAVSLAALRPVLFEALRFSED